MMVFDNFVFVHLPKTGGTFVETVLKKLHCPSKLGQKIHGMRRRWGVKVPFFPYRYREYRKHSQCKFIPEADRGKVILSCVRSPYDLYISHFKFGWWRTHAAGWFAPGSEMLERATREPERITFHEWVMGCRDQALWVHNRRKSHATLDLGWASIEFAVYFCREADAVFRAGPAAGDMARVFQEHAYPMHFLQMSRLNDGLYEFLKGQGYPEERVSFIKSTGKIYPGKQTRSSGDTVDSLYSPELREEVRYRERLLFELFPEYQSL